MFDKNLGQKVKAKTLEYLTETINEYCDAKYKFIADSLVDIGDEKFITDIAIYSSKNNELKGIIEIASNKTMSEIERRVDLCFANGLKSVWVLIPELGTIAVYQPYNKTEPYYCNVYTTSHDDSECEDLELKIGASFDIFSVE